MNFEKLCQIVQEIEYPGLEIALPGKEAKDGKDILFLQVVCVGGSDNVTGTDKEWKGRKWYLSPHMTKSEVVQTAFKAILTAIEHEARERFKFRDVSIFDPHYDVDHLVKLRLQANALDTRDDFNGC